MTDLTKPDERVTRFLAALGGEIIEAVYDSHVTIRFKNASGMLTIIDGIKAAPEMKRIRLNSKQVDGGHELTISK